MSVGTRASYATQSSYPFMQKYPLKSMASSPLSICCQGAEPVQRLRLLCTKPLSVGLHEGGITEDLLKLGTEAKSLYVCYG